MRSAREVRNCRRASRGHRSATVGLLVLLLPLLVGCDSAAYADSDGTSSQTALSREGRFGSLRDFVLMERPSLVAEEGDRGPSYFFLDRFEVTRGDWLAFAATAAGEQVAASDAALSGDPALPVGRVDLRQARAFAHWRFARLPRLDEWLLATVGDRRNKFPFPWGRKEEAARANAAELGLGEPLLVGTLESGRRAEGQPYDLIGNVSEWTESVPWGWCVDDGTFDADFGNPTSGMAVGWLHQRAMRLPGLSVWQAPGGLLPLGCAVAVGGVSVPREVVGADFLTPMGRQTEWVLAGDRRVRTGLRLCTTPTELLRALLRTDYEPTDLDFEQLRRFVARGRHRDVLVAAWPAVAAASAPSSLARPLGRWLAQHLGASLPAGAR